MILSEERGPGTVFRLRTNFGGALLGKLGTRRRQVTGCIILSDIRHSHPPSKANGPVRWVARRAPADLTPLCFRRPNVNNFDSDSRVEGTVPALLHRAAGYECREGPNVRRNFCSWSCLCLVNAGEAHAWTRRGEWAQYCLYAGVEVRISLLENELCWVGPVVL